MGAHDRMLLHHIGGHRYGGLFLLSLVAVKAALSIPSDGKKHNFAFMVLAFPEISSWLRESAAAARPTPRA
jgi:hypothetical protein